MSTSREEARLATVARRVATTSLAYPAAHLFLLYATGLWRLRPGASALFLCSAAVISGLRITVSRAQAGMPADRFVAVSTALTAASGLQFSSLFVYHSTQFGLTVGTALLLVGCMAISAGGTANLAPDRGMQLALNTTLLVPPLVAELFTTAPLEERIGTALGTLFYLVFMTVIGRQVNSDFMAGHTRRFELEERQAELEAARHRAEASSRAKGAFLANMSHEIRTPLNGVLGMAQVLAGTSLTPDQREAVNTILHSGEGLLVVLNDVLDFSKIESNKLAIEPVDFSPAVLASRAVDLFSTQASAKGIELWAREAGELPPAVHADELRIRQVLLNVLSNAIKFTSTGSVVLTLAHHDGVLSATVADTGSGMSAQTLERLFTPFEQGDPSTTRRYGGTGLGLAISHHLARLMGGQLEVKSELGVGSTFTLTVPAPAVSRGEAPRAHAPGRQGQLRVLVAEDNAVNQRVAQRLLEQLGCEVEVCGDGAEALRRIEARDFNVVIMDCQMPNVDGYTAVRALRSREAGTSRHLKVVGLTASAIDGDRERALASGMDDYLTKPVKLEALEAVLARL